MNKPIISFCALLMPLCANAQVEELFNEPMSKVERQKALKESLISQNLPEENGKVVLRYSTDIPGISKNECTHYSATGAKSDLRERLSEANGQKTISSRTSCTLP